MYFNDTCLWNIYLWNVYSNFKNWAVCLLFLNCNIPVYSLGYGLNFHFLKCLFFFLTFLCHVMCFLKYLVIHGYLNFNELIENVNIGWFWMVAIWVSFVLFPCPPNFTYPHISLLKSKGWRRLPGRFWYMGRIHWFANYVLYSIRGVQPTLEEEELSWTTH